MKKIEGLLIRLAIIHFVFLILSQWILTHDTWKRNVNKSIYYEGVIKGKNPGTMETIDR
ncbi:MULTISPECIES: DUF5359 family protein [unclassified Fictibacillus]|nr:MULTISPECIES: DUF5359 family protein [unclassified Fictibacillus]MED2972731.1 DUF5359 family protein [Fictibacillus sp. B-59209]UZJ80811.1 YpfB family protein [Fictibacillus sp. KU28468]SFD73014.1 hypothetical protein SAMN05428981_1011630 [Bacillus sp. OV194]